jgi:hypothetical protein
MRFEAFPGARAGLVIAAALALNACDQTAGLDSLSDPVIRDMALVSADATVEVVNTWSLPFGFSSVPQAADEMGHRMGGGFGIPGGGHGLGREGSGIVEKSFFDAAGIEQDFYDELATERIEVLAIISGERSRADWSATVYRERDMIITGLEGEETHRTINGEGHSEVTRSRHTEDGDRTYDMAGSFTYADVVIPVPGTEPRYPISGTITRTMTATRTDAEGNERTRTMEMTITFDGDETAVAIVNGETVEIDLSAREGRHPIRGRFGGS